jgi:hypothetical protein
VDWFKHDSQRQFIRHMMKGESRMTIRASSLEATTFSAVDPSFKKLFMPTSSTLLVKADFTAAKKSHFLNFEIQVDRKLVPASFSKG